MTSRKALAPAMHPADGQMQHEMAHGLSFRHLRPFLNGVYRDSTGSNRLTLRLNRTRGSHHQFEHPTKPATVTVPHPKKELGKGLVQAIRKQAGLK